MKQIHSFGEGSMLDEKREEALELAEKLDMPESIRTPGRTWTRYRDLDIDVEDVRNIAPKIKIEGDAEVFTGEEAVEEAGETMLDALKIDENRINALHAAYMNSLVYIKASDSDIRIVYEQEKPIFAHVVVETGESAEVSLTEEFRGNPGVLTSFNEFYLGDNSSMTYGAVESAGGFSYSARK
ncbi:MAG: hypothetical protein ABEJ72_03350, partial [Candidatus Aenigmatarchaeota archaeon]